MQTKNKQAPMRMKKITWFSLSAFSLFLFFSLLAIFFITNSLDEKKDSVYKAEDTKQEETKQHDLTLIRQRQDFTSNAYKDNSKLLAKKKIQETFKASTNNLGIVEIPFNAYNKSLQDTLVFRIKEIGANDWYFQGTYKTNQFQTDIPFPFGFPIIADSQNKSYTIELESLEGKPNNALSLSTKNPFFILKYKYSKEELKNDPNKLFQFIVGKTVEQIPLLSLNQFFYLLLSLLAPFIGYYIYKTRQFSLLLNGILIFMIAHLLLVSLAEILYLHPREYRDGALIDIAHQFAAGSNPFTIYNGLPHTYLYGFISPLVVAALSIFFRFDLALTQHAISFICMLLLCYLVYKEIDRSTQNKSLVLMSLVVVLLYNTVTFRPEPIAILLTIFSLYLVNNNKVVNFKKILFLSFSVIVLFYTKQYFIILFPVLAIYFLFNQSKKVLLYFVLSTLLLGAASVFLIDKLFPIYFTNTFFNYLPMASSYWTDWMVQQSIVYFQKNWLFVLLFVVLFFIGFVRNIDIRINITDFNKPLYKLTPTPLSNIYFIYSFVAILCLTFKFGNNGGAFLSYYTQLLPIPMLLFCIPYLFDTLKKYRFRQSVFVGIVTLFIIQTCTYISLPDINYSDEELAWDKAQRIIREHNPQQGYISPSFTIAAIKNGWPVSDNGHSEYYGLNAVGFPMPPEEATHRVLTPRLNEWQNDVDSKIKQKKYSFIIRPSKGHIKNELLTQYYMLQHRLDIPGFGTSEFWVPK